jgi:hypothetical protein
MRIAFVATVLAAAACGDRAGSPTSPSVEQAPPVLRIVDVIFAPAAGSVLTIGSSAEIVLSTSGGSPQGNVAALFYVRDDGATYAGHCSSWNGTPDSTAWIRPELSQASAQFPSSFYVFAKGSTINAVVLTAAGSSVFGGSCYFMTGNSATSPALYDRATSRRDLQLRWRVE